MKRTGQKLIKSLIVGGIITFGFSINSNESLAAELEGGEEQNPILEETNSIFSAEESDTKLQTMEDAAEVVEGDAIAEEGYLDAANEAIAADNLDEEKSDEILNGGKDVLDQAEEKAGQVTEIYGEISNEVEEKAADFENIAKERGLEEYVEKCNETADLQEKIDIIDEADKDAYSEYQKMEEEQAALEAKLDELDKNETEEHAILEAAIKKYEELLKIYEEIHNEWLALNEELGNGANVDPGLLAEYETRLKEFNQAKAALDESNAKFDEIYYERVQGEDNSEEEIEKWYSDLSDTLSYRQTKRAEYVDADNRLKEINADGKLEKYRYYLELSEREEEAYFAQEDAYIDVVNAESNVYALYDEIIERLEDLRISMRDEHAYYQEFNNLYLEYRDALLNLVKAQEIKKRSDESLQKTKDAYSNLTEVVSEYSSKGADVQNIRDAVEDIQKAVDEINKTIDYEEAKDNDEIAHSEYEKIKETTEAIAEKYEKASGNNGLEGYVDRINAAATTEEKIAIIDEAIAALKAKLDSYADDNAISSEEYQNLIEKIALYEKNYVESEKKYNDARAAYDKKINENRAAYESYEQSLKEEERLKAKKSELEKQSKELSRAKGTVEEKFYKYYDREWYDSVMKEPNERVEKAETILFNPNNTLEDVVGILGEYIDASFQRAIYVDLFAKASRIYSDMRDVSMEYEKIHDDLYAPYGVVREGYYLYTDYFGEVDEEQKLAKKNLDEVSAALDDLKKQKYRYVLGKEYDSVAGFLNAAEVYKMALMYTDEAKELVYSADCLTKETELAYKLADCSTTITSEYDTVIKGKPMVITGTVSAYTKVLESTVESVGNIQQLCENARDTIYLTVQVTISDMTGVVATIVRNINVAA